MSHVGGPSTHVYAMKHDRQVGHVGGRVSVLRWAEGQAL